MKLVRNVAQNFMFFDLAKSTISRALGPQGPSLPFHIGPKVLEQDQNSLWTLHEGTRKVDKFNARTMDNLFQCLYSTSKQIQNMFNWLGMPLSVLKRLDSQIV